MVLIGISTLILFLFTTPLSSGVHPSFVLFPFHFGFIGIIFLILIIFLISRWIFWSNRCGNSTRYYSHVSGSDNVQNILKERYAKGEITKEQFVTDKKRLGTKMIEL